MLSDPAVDDAARAVLDGTPVDWDSLESSADLGTRALAEQLKVLSAVGRVHRAEPSPAPAASPFLTAPPPDSPDGIRRWGHLQLLEKVGSGAFGEVYRAWDTRLDREVALKLLRAGAVFNDQSSPIIREGRLLARVRHENVATIYGAELVDGRIGLWMEFIHGRTLEDLLRAGHQFSLSEVVGIGSEICRAVSAVHAAGLLHRDIKAQNVMRADGGRVVLMDFGAGLDQAETGAHVTGTPLYLAPEVLDGRPATVQSDVYSVGVLLFHLLTGAWPVGAESLEELRRAHARGERADLGSLRSDLPPAIVRIVQRATDAELERRYETCDALAADLRPLERQPTGRRWAAAALVAVATGLGAWLAWDARGLPEPGTARPAASRAGTSGVAGTWEAMPGLASAALAPFDRPVIVVLPFSNLSVEPESDLVVDGLTYEIIRNLAIIDGLEVKSATSSFALRGQDLDLADIGRRLGVNLVLEGSVLQAGGQWRVLAQLAQVAGDTPLWSGRFDREANGMFAVQDEISRAVVNQLRLTMGKGQRRYDLDPEASTLYLKARALAERRGTPSAEAAVGLFEQVIARDPAFAPAYAGLADAVSFMSQTLPDVGGLPPDRAIALMRPAASKALDLDPLLAEAHAAMGFLHAREHAWEDADRAFRRALELNPSLTHVHTTYALTTLLPLGRFGEADALLEDALRRDPLSPEVLRDQAFGQINAGRYDEAVDNLAKVRAVDPGLAYVDLLMARALTFAGRVDEAMPYWESVSGELGSQHWIAYAYVRAGRRAEIERLVARHQNPYRLAIMHAALGDRDRALEALARAADEAPHRVVRLLTYPEMAPLRGDPRFEAIRVKFRMQ